MVGPIGGPPAVPNWAVFDAWVQLGNEKHIEETRHRH